VRDCTPGQMGSAERTPWRRVLWGIRNNPLDTRTLLGLS
jgi:hypothetical protein